MLVCPRVRGNTLVQKEHPFWERALPRVSLRAVKAVWSTRRSTSDPKARQLPVTLQPQQSMACTGSHSEESVMFKLPPFWAPRRTLCGVVLGSSARSRGMGMGLLPRARREPNYRDPGAPPDCLPEFEVLWDSWGKNSLEGRIILMTQDSNCNNHRFEWVSLTLSNCSSKKFVGHNPIPRTARAWEVSRGQSKMLWVRTRHVTDNRFTVQYNLIASKQRQNWAPLFSLFFTCFGPIFKLEQYNCPSFSVHLLSNLLFILTHFIAFDSAGQAESLDQPATILNQFFNVSTCSYLKKQMGKANSETLHPEKEVDGLWSQHVQEFTKSQCQWLWKVPTEPKSSVTMGQCNWCFRRTIISWGKWNPMSKGGALAWNFLHLEYPFFLRGNLDYCRNQLNSVIANGWALNPRTLILIELLSHKSHILNLCYLPGDHHKHKQHDI